METDGLRDRWLRAIDDYSKGVCFRDPVGGKIIVDSWFSRKARVCFVVVVRKNWE